jgi:hypothetical protein
MARLRKAATILGFSAAVASLLSSQAAACDCGTVYFLVSDFLPGGRASSYVLGLSNEQDKQHARALIQYVKGWKNTPEEPFQPPEPGAIVLAEVGWSADGMNRNHLVPGKPEWWWHVTRFLGFTPASVEIADGSPEVVHLYHIAIGGIGFWDYTVTAELGPALCLCVTREQGAMRFVWSDLSTNAAYVGTNYVYTLETRDDVSQAWVPVPGGSWPTRQTEWLQPADGDTATRFYRVRAELLDDRSWQPVTRDCETVFFRVDNGSVVEGRFHPMWASSFVVPLSEEEDKRHARALIKHLKETPEKPLPEDPGVSVMVAVAWGGDGINRNHLLPGKPAWPWNVSEFLGFIPYTGGGTPSVMPEWVNPSSERISFGAYVITAELGPAFCLSVSRAADALRFEWPDLSTNAAYGGTNWAYTVESREAPPENWAPVPGSLWPTRQTEWVQSGGGDAPMRLYRLRAELLKE